MGYEPWFQVCHTAHARPCARRDADPIPEGEGIHDTSPGPRKLTLENCPKSICKSSLPRHTSSGWSTPAGQPSQQRHGAGSAPGLF